jgi:hypothetical protein
MTWTQHVSIFFRSFFETFFTPSVFRELWESSTEDGHENAFQNVACRLASEGYIFFGVGGFYNNLYYTQGVHFHSIKMPKKRYQYIRE